METLIRKLLWKKMGDLEIKDLKELSEISGVSYATIWRIMGSEKPNTSPEPQNPTYDNLVKLLNTLHIPCLEDYATETAVKIVSELKYLDEDKKQVLLHTAIDLKNLSQKP